MPIETSWREAYTQEELTLPERGYKPTFAVMKRKIDFHDKKFVPSKSKPRFANAMSPEAKQARVDILTISWAIPVVALPALWLTIRI